MYSWGKRTVSIESQTIEIVLYRTDLKTNKTEKIMSYEKSAAQNSYLKDFDCDIQAVKDTLYIKTCSYDENDDMFIYTIYCTQGENLTELMKSYAPRDCNKRIEGNEYASIKGYAVNTKYIYYIDELSSDKLDIEAALFRYNIKTGEKKRYMTCQIQWHMICNAMMIIYILTERYLQDKVENYVSLIMMQR